MKLVQDIFYFAYESPVKKKKNISWDHCDEHNTIDFWETSIETSVSFACSFEPKELIITTDYHHINFIFEKRTFVKKEFEDFILKMMREKCLFFSFAPGIFSYISFPIAVEVNSPIYLYVKEAVKKRRMMHLHWIDCKLKFYYRYWLSSLFFLTTRRVYVPFLLVENICQMKKSTGKAN